MDDTRKVIQKVFKESQELISIDDVLDGEWWLEDSGDPTFADGDIGDINHEMAAFQSAIGVDFEHDIYVDVEDAGQQVLDTVQARSEEEYYKGVLQRLAEDTGNSVEELLSAENAVDVGLDEGYWFNVIERSAGSEIKDDVYAEFLIAQGGNEESIRWFQQHPNADAREWAIKTQGWIRVAGTNFQLWEFTDEAKESIADFVFNEAAESGYDEDELDPNSSISVEELSPNGKYFDVSLADLQDSSKSAAAIKGRDILGKVDPRSGMPFFEPDQP
jgi:hypothetical protein